ncbi:MAG: glycosyl transferase group 1 [uncultured bacterium]|nr:MAG: glycosyl transferase group 1 [uncultured bacterium]
MKVALVKPPLSGHLLRGTGVYFDNLAGSLRSYTAIEVVICTSNQLPKSVDLYHFPYFDPFFLTLPPLRSKKTIVTVHDLTPIKFPQHFPRGLKGELKWQIQRFLLKTVRAIVTDSFASKKDLMALVGINPDKIYPIYLAPAEKFLSLKTKTDKQNVLDKYKLPKKFVMFVGEVNWNKNLVNVIRAIKMVNIPLVIVSQSFAQRKDWFHPANVYLKQAIQEAGNSNLIYPLNQVKQADLICLYQLAAALVYPSYYEGFGLPVVEAMSSGCPVVTSAKGSLKEIVGSAALIIDPDSVTQITGAIKTILQNKRLTEQLIIQGSLQAKKFSWSKTARDTAQVYQQVYP